MDTEEKTLDVKEIMASIQNEIKEKYPGQIDVEKIMAEIRREIREKGYADDTIPFSDIHVNMAVTPQGNTEDYINALEARSHVAAYRPLASNRRLGAIIIFVKKIIRKLAKFYIEPIVTDQNENNRLITACIKDLHLRTMEMDLSLRRLQDENDELRRVLERYRK